MTLLRDIYFSVKIELLKARTMILKILTNFINFNPVVQAGAVVVSFLVPLASIIHVVLVLLVVDAVTSIYYQMRTESLKHQGFWDGDGISNRLSLWLNKTRRTLKVIESGKGRKTLEKMFFYVLIITAFFLFDTYVLQLTASELHGINTFSLTNLATVLICLVELTSIASNVSKITGNPIFEKIVKIFTKKTENRLDIGGEDGGL